MAGSARRERIEGEVQRVLSTLVAREVRDPRVGSVTITAVQLAPDLSVARIFFLPFGGRHTADEVREGLASAAGFLRGEVGRRLSLRHAPARLGQWPMAQPEDRVRRVFDPDGRLV